MKGHGLLLDVLIVLRNFLVPIQSIGSGALSLELASEFFWG